MKKSILLTKSNLQGARGQTAAVVALIFLGAMMLNLWLMLSMDYKQNFRRCHERLNGEHVSLAVDGDQEQMREFLSGILEEDERVEEFSLEPAMQMVGLFDYNGGEVNTNFVIMEKESALGRPIGRAELIPQEKTACSGGREDESTQEDGQSSGEGPRKAQSGVYLPMLYQSDEIAVGKTITITIGGNPVAYPICGFFNSPMMGSHNCMLCALLLTRDRYEELEKLGYAPGATLCGVRLKDPKESETFETELKNAVSASFPQAYATGNSYALVSQSRFISQMICSGVMSAMAFLILLIALVVIVSNIFHYIQENMKNLGALKALGYTGRQLSGSVLVQFSILSLGASLAGMGVSYLLFPLVNEMMISQTGIPYRVHFLPLPALLTLAAPALTVALAVWISTGRIRRIEPVTALRQGMMTHSFKRNHIPLENTCLPLQSALALKTTLSGIKHNLTVCITMLALSLVVVFSGLMTENMIVDMEPFFNLIVGEVADSCINVGTDIEKDFLREMNGDKRVEKIYPYSSLAVSHVGGLELVTTICDDFSRVNNQDVVFQGRFPRYDNEIAIAAKYAGEKDLAIGDEVVLTAEGEERAYLITGFTQVSNNLGKDALMTREGYERLGKLWNVSYYLNLSEGTDVDAFNREAKERWGGGIYAAINVKATVEAGSSVYVSLMRAIVFAILALGLVVVVFVLFLLVRTMLGSKKRDYGIMKALGFTTAELIWQTAVSLMPAVILSAAAGLTISALIINPLTAVFLRGIGIVKCTFRIPVGFILAGGLGLCVFTFGAACLLSLRVKRITPRAMLAGE